LKQNCWDFKKCGRTPDGAHADDLGVCPVTTYTVLNNVHGGRNAGRSCWVVTGSLCGGKVQGNEEQKRTICWGCDFLKLVRDEEEPTSLGFRPTRLGMDRLLARANGG